MNPIILYDNRFDDGTPVATDTETGDFDVLNIRDLRTYTYHKFDAAGTKYITVDCGSAKPADALGIIGHNFFTAGAVISVECSSDNFATETIEALAEFTLENDKAFLKTFTEYVRRYWRIKVVTAAVQAYLAVAILGSRLEFPYPPDTPFLPFSESVESEGSRSITGNLLGSVIECKPLEISVIFSNLLRSFVIDSYKPFWDDHASEMKPFFWSWDNDEFPEHAFFVAMDETQKFEMPMSMSSVIDSLSFKMKGIKEE